MTLMTAPRPAKPALFPLWTGVKAMYGIWCQRQALRRLDDRALADIGVSRAEALAEARRPAWDAPETWRI